MYLIICCCFFTKSYLILFAFSQETENVFIFLTSRSLQVFVLSGVIAMVTCAVFLRLNSLLKLAVLLLAVAVYSYLIHVAFLTLARHDMQHRSVQEHILLSLKLRCPLS